MIKYLRGENCSLNTAEKKLYMTIHKSCGTRFSINDKVQGYVNRGWTAVINLPNRTIEITRECSYAKKEEVPSKFAGSRPWARFWYDIFELKRKGQGELF